MPIKAGIVGISGYTGQTCVKLISQHPELTCHQLFSTSIIGDVSNDFFNLSDLPYVESLDNANFDDLDVLFLAVPHTTAIGLVKQIISQCPSLKIVDLSADFRLNSATDYSSAYGQLHTYAEGLNQFVYGCPEKYREQIKGAQYVANPGCYATSVILGLLPLVTHIDKAASIIVDAKSGVSGAGKKTDGTMLFCDVADYVSAYSTGTHRHQAEFNQELGFSQLLFSPHLVPTKKGIESAIYIPNAGVSESTLKDLFNDYYEDHPFVTVLDSEATPSTRLVNETNQCVIIPKVIDGTVVIFSLIDNLMKGAAGQAIQNANLMFSLPETSGLQ